MAVERPPIPDLIEVQRNGVRAIESITSRFDDRDWVAPTPCEGWTALDLAGHLVTAIDNWHILLDDSEAGAASARFTWQEMDAHFQRMLALLPDASGPERIETFGRRAESYFDRVADLDPELPLVSALTDIAAIPVTVGLFAWIGGTEWHVHAWDLAQVLGETYHTDHAATFYAGSMTLRGNTPTSDVDPWRQP